MREEFRERVNFLVSTGISRDRAEYLAREDMGLPHPKNVMSTCPWYYECKNNGALCSACGFEEV